MKASVVRIGNSRGIRIPKTVLDECGIAEEVDLKVEKRRIILEPVKARPRSGWAESFREMRVKGDDRLLLPDGIDAELKDWNW
jgi:antitoxin MazE